MSKVNLLPIFIDRINDIIIANNIDSQITLKESDNTGIGSVVTMSWQTQHNGYLTTMTVDIVNESDW